MSDYLRDRFPLDSTSTQYMSGKAVYNLVRWRVPGIIAPVELFPADAETFREAVREAMADAWDAGWWKGADALDGWKHSEEWGQDFDRWLAAHDAEVRREQDQKWITIIGDAIRRGGGDRG